jgi:hypothetical protein
MFAPHVAASRRRNELLAVCQRLMEGWHGERPSGVFAAAEELQGLLEQLCAGGEKTAVVRIAPRSEDGRASQQS